MTESAASFRFGDFLFDGRSHRLVRGDGLVHLKPKEWELLRHLIEHRDRVVTKAELIEALWPRQTISEANLTQTVYRVRQALCDSAQGARWIQTVARLGYRFAGEVEAVESDGRDAAAVAVAVIPFVDSFQPDRPSDWSLGLTEATIRVLAENPELEVRPLSAVMYVDSSADGVVEASRPLKVDVLVSGEISDTAGTRKVVGHALDARTGALRASRVWIVDSNDGGASQLQIARDIPELLRSSRSREDLPRTTIELENHEARTAYLRGRYCWHQFTDTSLRQAIELFDRALEIAPRSAPALAWRSGAWAALGNIGTITPRESAERARRDADRAIAIDDRLAAGFEMRGVIELYFDWNLESALRSLDLAIERDPDSANAHHLRGNALAFAGSFESAFRSIERAEHLDPTSLITATDLGLICYFSGDYENARGRLQDVLAQNEHFAHARLWLAFVLAAQGNFETALAHVDRIASDEGGALAEQALLQGRLGHLDEAHSLLDQLASKRQTGPIDPYRTALGLLGVDDEEACLDQLERALEYRSRLLVLLGVDPIWRPLHSNPRFRSLTRQVGLLPLE